MPGAGTTAAAAAAAAAKYSQQAVAAHAATVKRRRLDDKAQTRRLRETVQRPRLLEQQQDPLTRLRMRNAIEGVYAGGRSNRVVADVAACYGAGLVRRTLLVRDHLPLVQKFAVDEVTAAMVTAASSGIPGRNFVSHWPHFRRRGGGGAPYTEISYDIMPTEEPVSALLITPRPRNFVMWATPAGSRHPGSIRIVPFGQGLERGGREGPGRDDEDDDDDGGGGGGGGGASRAAAVSYGDTAIAYAIPDVDIWDMAASPSGLGVVAGCTSGLCVFGDASQQPQQGWGSTMTRRHRDTEFMAVAFKDEHVVLAGTRAGAVHVADLRSGAGTATALTRLRHGSGVTAVRALANDNYVAVRGLATVSIYDLRYTPLSKALSRPYMTFGGACAADRFGLGFDYDPVLGLIATGMCCSFFLLSGHSFTNEFWQFHTTSHLAGSNDHHCDVRQDGGRVY